MDRHRRHLVIALVVCAAALLGAGAAGAAGGAAAPDPAAPVAAAASTPAPLIEGFSAASPYLSVTNDNDRFVHGTADVATKRVRFVPGKLGDCMRVDFFMRGGLWKNVMVQVNKRVPLNLTGQDKLELTMKGDWADAGGAQSVTVALTMLNGALYYQSLTVHKAWHTYDMALDPAGSAWGTDGPNWGARDAFTLDKVATITFFVSPPKTGDYSLYFDDLAVTGGPVQPYVDTDAPVPEQFTSIPYAIGQAVDDMGWRDWDNRRKSVRNYQVLLNERASLADYRNLVAIGKAAGTRLTTVWIMQDLDKHGTCAKAKYNTPVAKYDMTSDGTRWTNHITPDQRGVMGLVKDNAAFMEFGMHGVSHEHFRNGVEQRAEYAHIDESKPGRAPLVGLGRHEPQGAVLPRAAAPVLHAATARHAGRRSPAGARLLLQQDRSAHDRRAAAQVRRQVRQRRDQRVDERRAPATSSTTACSSSTAPTAPTGTGWVPRPGRATGTTSTRRTTPPTSTAGRRRTSPTRGARSRSG